ncbi:MAG: peroxidase family protein [Planctomycetota bacterium]|nr:peroxidase family protein [Planctomycetota bacterium]
MKRKREIGFGVAAFICLTLPSFAQQVRDGTDRSPQSRSRKPNAQAPGQTPRTDGREPFRGDNGAIFPLEFRSVDGSENHRSREAWGKAEETFARRVRAAYADGVGAPSGALRPNPRTISNLVCVQGESTPNPQGASSYLWAWGQFLDHDITETPTADPIETFDILVPTGDAYFDPASTGSVSIPLNRSSYDLERGRREQVNAITSFIDGSQIYGSDLERAHGLRTLDGTGRMRTSAGDFLPYNTGGLPNVPSNSAAFFVAGDVRANEQVLLTALHTVFVREHNHWAGIFASRGDLDGETIYQLARAVVVGELQSITYNEFVPALLGPDGLRDYRGYRDRTRPSITNLFAAAGFRLGHSLLPSELLRLQADGESIPGGSLALADAFFRPDRLLQDGLEPYLLGAALQRSETLDTMIVEDLRSFLFGAPGSGGLDLAALNIQRGRDHGLPGYLEIRRELGLAPIEGFLALTGDVLSARRLSNAYGELQHVDAWVGFLSEPTRPGAMVGEGLHRLMREQFEALRDGDRFYYESYLPERIRDLVETQTLGVILARNTSLGDDMPIHVFHVR